MSTRIVLYHRFCGADRLRFWVLLRRWRFSPNHLRRRVVLRNSPNPNHVHRRVRVSSGLDRPYHLHQWKPVPGQLLGPNPVHCRLLLSWNHQTARVSRGVSVPTWIGVANDLRQRPTMPSAIVCCSAVSFNLLLPPSHKHDAVSEGFFLSTGLGFRHYLRHRVLVSGRFFRQGDLPRGLLLLRKRRENRVRRRDGVSGGFCNSAGLRSRPVLPARGHGAQCVCSGLHLRQPHSSSSMHFWPILCRRVDGRKTVRYWIVLRLSRHNAAVS